MIRLIKQTSQFNDTWTSSAQTTTGESQNGSPHDQKQEPIAQREGALNLCRYADSTCCQMALAQHSLYGKYYNSLSSSRV